MSIWVILLVGGLATFATRFSFILLLDHLRMPDWFRRGLQYVPLTVLSAIILPELTNPNGTLWISWRNPQLLAGIIAILVAWRTRNVLLTIFSGMAALLILRAVLVLI